MAPSGTAGPCTICGAKARLCNQCQSAAYCSAECQQADWRTHKLLCLPFDIMRRDNFGARPSPNHYLAIYFAMDQKYPILGWVNTKPDVYTPGQVHPILDDLLKVPGSQGYVGRRLKVVRGNVLRGRRENPDTINIWHLDPDGDEPGMTTNQTVHGTIPTLIGDTWGDTIWQGPIVVVLKEGKEFDPKLVKDINLTAYRDAIDYLGYFQETCGSMIDGLHVESHISKAVMAERAGKTMGVKVSCMADKSISGLDMIERPVPKSHSLFNLEGDDPLAVPEILGLQWVAKAYERVETDSPGVANPLARLLLMRVTTKKGKWQGLRGRWNDPNIGSVLVVERLGRVLSMEVVRAVCTLIQEVVPLLMEERAKSSTGEREVREAIQREGGRRSICR